MSGSDGFKFAEKLMNGLDLDEKELFFFENFAGAAAFFSCKNDELRLLRVNQRYLDETGIIDGPEMYASDVWCFRDEYGAALMLSKVKAAIETGAEQVFETWRRTFSQCCGEDYLCIKSAVRCVGVLGDTAVLYADVHDVTKERRKQREVEESEEKFRSAAEQANVYAWEYTVATKQMRPCFRCMRDLGLPALLENYPEPAFEAGIFPWDYADMYRDWHRQIAAGVPYLEGIIPLTVGRVPFHVRYTTEFDENGNPVRAFGSATLVVDNDKEAEYREIVNTLSGNFGNVFHIFLEEDSFKITKADGYLPKELKAYVGSETTLPYFAQCEAYVNDRVVLEDRERVLRAFCAEIVKAELDKSREYSVTYRIEENGETHYIQAVFFYTGDLKGAICAFQNVDKTMREEKERAKELKNALDSARRANAAKSTFLSHMSHDIRTPLNGIIGLLDMEDRHPSDLEMITVNRNKMRIAANHLLSLINDVLDLSKMEDENTTLAKEAFDIRTIYGDVLSIAGMRASEESITLTRVDKHSAFQSPFVYGSPLHVRKILLNIINNAIKYNRPNGSVCCEVDSVLKGKTVFYKFTVQDTGIGMSEEFQKHMFEPFSQERSDARSVFQGTGLGMSIVKALVTKMNGDIQVHSVMGEGSTFTVTIPFAVAPAEAVEEKGKNEVPVSLENVKILLAEDNELNAEIATALLEDVGAEVALVSDGQQAVDAVAGNPEGTFDVVLMDVMMPVMDGLEATRCIRAMARPDCAELPIIAMTANAFAEDVQSCKAAGMNAHIAKPMNVRTAIATIAAFMR